MRIGALVAALLISGCGGVVDAEPPEEADSAAQSTATCTSGRTPSSFGGPCEPGETKFCIGANACEGERECRNGLFSGCLCEDQIEPPAVTACGAGTPRGSCVLTGQRHVCACRVGVYRCQLPGQAACDQVRILTSFVGDTASIPDVCPFVCNELPGSPNCVASDAVLEDYCCR